MKKLDLGKDNINQLLLTFSIPCVISMLINSIYNIVDQIFIGQGVGTLGNAATNVIFPLVIVFNAVAGLIGNGAAANLSLKLGEGDKKSASKSIGGAIVLSVIFSVLLSFLSYLFLPKLVYLFGCTDTVYSYAVDYGRIIILGAPFMMIYSSFSSIIRADGSPKYSMVLLVIGALLNIILDPIFIFLFNMGVKGGALATIIGQFVSFLIALFYLPKIKSVFLVRDDFLIDKSSFKILGLGLSSFITQCTVLALFIFMNNIMTKYGARTEYGADIPLSVYGVISKINSLYISTVLGISIGAQPIIGFNYGAGEYERVLKVLKKVLIVNFVIGIFFNIIFLLFPTQIVSIFIRKSDEGYSLFLSFAKIISRSFMLVCSLNALEMTTSIVIQSLGKVVKSTAVSFIRQIILFIPIASLLCIVLDYGIYGALYAGAIADGLCFLISIFIFRYEYVKLKNSSLNFDAGVVENKTRVNYSGRHVVVTISREYGSGGRYVGQILAERLGLKFYDKELIRLSAKESGLSEKYVSQNDQVKTSNYQDNNDDRLFLAESKVIRRVSRESCVIVGRLADYILRDNKDVIKVFLYSDMDSKVKRVVKYYGVDLEKAEKVVNKVNRDRAKHYKYYTSKNWNDFSNYDICLNVDKYGVEECSKILENIIREKK